MIAAVMIPILMITSGVMPSVKRSAIAHYGTAILKRARGDVPAAQNHLLQASQLDPSATEPLRFLMSVQTALTRDPAAIRTGQKILRREPSDIHTAMGVSELLLKSQRALEANAVLLPFAETNMPAETAWDYWDLVAKVHEQRPDDRAAAAALRKRISIYEHHKRALATAHGWTDSESTDACAQTWERLGQSLLKCRQFDESAKAFFQAHDRFRQCDTAAAKRLPLNLARTFVKADDVPQAVSHYGKYLQDRPDDLAAMIELVQLRISNGKYDEAVRDLEARLAKSKKPDDIAWLLAVVRLHQGKLETTTAIMQFEQWAKTRCEPSLVALAVDALPRDALFDWYDVLSKQLVPEHGAKKEIRLGALARALADAIRARPAVAKVFIDRAIVVSKQGQAIHSRTAEFAGWLAERANRLKDAEAAYRAIRNPNWEQLRPLVNLLERQFQWSRVAELCRQELNNRERNISALYLLAYCQAELGDVKESLRIVEQLARDERLFAEGKFTVRLQQCRILTASGHAQSAISLALPLFDMANGPAELARLRQVLGDAYFGAGKLAEGEAQMRAILETDPDDALTLNNLAYALAEHKRNLADAETFATYAVEQDKADRLRGGDPAPASGTYLDTLGWVYFQRGKLAEARKTFEDALALPDSSFNPVVWDHYGDVLNALGEKDQAQRAWRKAFDGYPDTAEGKRSGKRAAVGKKIAGR